MERNQFMLDDRINTQLCVLKQQRDKSEQILTYVMPLEILNRFKENITNLVDYVPHGSVLFLQILGVDEIFTHSKEKFIMFLDQLNIMYDALEVRAKRFKCVRVRTGIDIVGTYQIHWFHLHGCIWCAQRRRQARR